MKDLALLVLLLFPWSSFASAHSLGVDPGQFNELPGGRYHLVSQVPQNFAPLITTPEIPNRCAFEGNPRGARGVYEVRFVFVCETPLKAGDVLRLPWQREGVMLTVNWLSGAAVTGFAGREGAYISIDLAQYQAGSGSAWEGARRYTLLGFEHILEGIDHLLFVLALLLVVRTGWQLVKTITAFTVAHSITLGLATLGFVHVPAAPVESAIALSIVFLAVEIIHAQQGRPGMTFTYPWVVAFAFGLLHGFGFAGALSEVGLPSGEIPLALLFFNIGVELGQLAFVLCVMLIFTALRFGMRLTDESRLVMAGERTLVYLIGVLASYWLIERSLEVFGVTA